ECRGQQVVLTNRISTVLEAMMMEEVWAESVGTSSRATRASILSTFSWANMGNTEADLGSAALACLIATMALTKDKARGMRLMRGLVQRNATGATWPAD
ncbi:unnamed protein product, partial [Symbiodinium pilosum]